VSDESKPFVVEVRQVELMPGMLVFVAASGWARVERAPTDDWVPVRWVAHDFVTDVPVRAIMVPAVAPSRTDMLKVPVLP